MNREKMTLSMASLRYFIDNSLHLSEDAKSVTGFILNEPLLDAAAYNTYVETVSDKSDTLYMRIKESLTGMVTDNYLDYIRRLSTKFDWKSSDVILAFDYTDEDFYGDVQGFSIHGWTGKNGITGKFKFLTCSIVSDDIPEKIPLISIPIAMGHYKSQAILHCLSLIKPFIGEIRLILFDRGFYDKDLMYELSKNEFPYLIFVPKHQDKKDILSLLKDEEKQAMVYDFTFYKDKTKHNGETLLTFLRQIYDPRSEKSYDWVFATSMDEVELSNIIGTYKKRWRIETGFRVQDEARIKCKSKDMKIRYFLFLYQQMLQTLWVCFYKNEVSFKKFIIEMQNLCKELIANPVKPHRRSKTQKD